MELHSPAVGKKLWSYIRVVFFMMRKGLISKRKLILDMNLMMKKGRLLGKSLGKNLVFHHRSSSRSGAPPRGFGFGLQEYEFSCSNSPIPVFAHVGTTSRRRHNYFPCVGAATDEADHESSSSSSSSLAAPKPVTTSLATQARIEYSHDDQCRNSYNLSSYDLAPGETLSPLPSPAPFSTIRISNYSSEEEVEEEGRGGAEREDVNDEAEEFIRRFYRQLRAQSRIGLLEYQEREIQQMLARAT